MIRLQSNAWCKQIGSASPGIADRLIRDVKNPGRKRGEVPTIFF